MAKRGENSAGPRFRLQEAGRALRHRNYRLYFSGQCISLVGTWMQMVAQSWLVYRLTGSSVLLGAVGFVGQIPFILLAPVAGHVADRYRRHRVILWMQIALMVQAFVLAALTLTGTVRVWHIFVLAALQGVILSFDVPARQSFVVHMVEGREDLSNAIALNSSMHSGGRVVGPAIAGLLVAAFGEGWCFLANGVSFIAVIAGLLMMTVQEQKREVHDSPLKSIQEGLQYAAVTRPLRALLLLLGLTSVCAMPYVVLMPIFADQILHGGARAMGMLMGASGVGAVAGLLILASRTGTKGLSRWVLSCSLGLSVTLIGFSLSRSLWLSLVLLIPVGGFMMVNMAGINTLIQSMVPDRLRGRVMSVYSMMFQGMAPFGALLGGFLGHQFGAPAAVAISGVACLAGALVFGARLPSMRPELKELVRAQGMGSATPEVATPGGGN